MDYHYGIRLEFSQSEYDDVLLFLDSQNIHSFEEGESVINDKNEFEFINEYSLITLRFNSIEESESFKLKIKKELSSIKIKDLGKEENYLNEWKKFAKPIEITPSITIVPSWIAEEENYKESSEITKKITLDAGYAFGSGNHETTTLCAREIERLIPVDSILDVGCGSGILSMIASKLGTEKIKAIDIDPQAVKTASENAESNSISNIEFSNEKLSNITQEYDLVVANILSHVLLELKKDLIRIVKPGGFLILSGILVEEIDKVIKEFGLKVLHLEELNEWGVLVLKSSK